MQSLLGNPVLRRLARRVLPRHVRKARSELGFWEANTRERGIEPRTEQYRRFMLAMGGLEDASFFDDKVCLDVGCGPMGSLTWLKNARAAVGLDPLCEGYMRFGIDRHEMLYLNARSENIPLPTNYVDVVFSMNSLDHVDSLRKTCGEIRRILKPGGFFIGSLNLDEPATDTEPWTLNERLLDELLFKSWTREFYRIGPKLNATKQDEIYRHLFDPSLPSPEPLDVIGRVLWCRYRTPSN